MLYTQRIFWPQYNTPEKLARLHRFLAAYRGLAQEISFFTEGDGIDWRYLPPAEVQQRAAFLSAAVAQTRAAGFIPVINVLNTLGHSDEGGDVAPPLPWQGIVDTDGKTARNCSCPSAPALLEYVRFKYEAFARCGADRYWIDDDFRIQNHRPVKLGCFCDQCVANFSCRTGQTWERPRLVEALRTDPALRSAWLAHCTNTMQALFDACVAGICAGHPTAEIGLMTYGATTFAVDTIVEFERCQRLTGRRCWLRPGGGFWRDDAPRELLGKLEHVAQAIDYLPADVATSYEVENYPYTTGTKSATMTGLECLLVILSTRLDGIMFDVLDGAGNDPAVSHSRWLSELARWQPLWDQAATAVAGTEPIGWRPAYSRQHFQQVKEVWDVAGILAPPYHSSRALQLAGLPYTGFRASAAGSVLCGPAARGMNQAELVALLTAPLIMDGDAAQCFLDEGLGERIGVHSVQLYQQGLFERFTDHPLNRGMEHFNRAATQAYLNLASHTLQLTPQAEAISQMFTYDNQCVGAGLSLYQPGDGMPVAVLGHMPWAHLLSKQRMTQLRRLSELMLNARVPVTLQTEQPIVLWVRRQRSALKWVIILFNAGFDPAADVQLQLAASAASTSASLPLATPGVQMDPTTTGLDFRLPGWGVAVVEIQGLMEP